MLGSYIITNQIINEAKVLKDKTLNADIPKPHRKKLKKHLKDVIKQPGTLFLFPHH